VKSLKSFLINWAWLIGVVILAIGVSVFLLLRSGSKDTVKPKRGDIVESIYGLGTVVPESVYRASVGVNLGLDKMFVKEGDRVRRGDPLAQLEQVIMRSPISGTVTSAPFKEGEMIPMQANLVTVTNFENMFLEVSLEQQLVLRVRKGQEVLVSFENIRNEKLNGEVASVYPRENQFIVRILLPIWPKGVLPGMTADTAILVGKKSDVLLIPVRAIAAGQVTRIRDGKKERIAVRLDTMDGEWGEVVEGDIRETDELLIRR
jgi:membrane fusion protein, macrolide-specific efflux system